MLVRGEAFVQVPDMEVMAAEANRLFADREKDLHRFRAGLSLRSG